MNLRTRVRAIFICIEAHLFTICIYLEEVCPYEKCEGPRGRAVYTGSRALESLKFHIKTKHSGEAPPAWWTEEKYGKPD